MSKKPSDKSPLDIAQEKLISFINPTITSHYVHVGDTRIHYITAGKGRPIVMLHGATLGWGQWYRNISTLSKKYKVIAIDLPGAGMSSRVDFRKEQLEKLFVDNVAGCMELLKIQPYDVVGHSFGGWVAAKLALKYPKRIGKLVLINPVGLSRDIPKPFNIVSLSPLIPKILQTFMLGKSIEKTESFLRTATTSPKTVLSPYFVNYFHTARMVKATQSPFHLIASALHRGKLKEEYFMLPHFNKISSKTLIVWGKKDTSMHYPIALKHVKNPLVRLHVYKDSGHIPFIEKAKHFNQLLLSFLQG